MIKMTTVENMKISYINFDPPSDVKATTKMIARELIQRSPSDASLQISLEIVGHTITGVCQIHSLKGHFRSEVIATTPLEAMVTLAKNMNAKLEAWRNSRSFAASKYKRCS